MSNEDEGGGKVLQDVTPKVSIVNGKALKMARLEEDATQSDLAKILMISKGTYSKKENGLVNTTIDEAVEIAEKLKMDFNTFNKVFANNRLKREKLEYQGKG